MKILPFIIYLIIAIVSSVYSQNKKKQKENSKKPIKPILPGQFQEEMAKKSSGTSKNVLSEYERDKKMIFESTLEPEDKLLPVKRLTREPVEKKRVMGIDKVNNTSSSRLVSVVEREEEIDIYDLTTLKGSIQPEINRNTLIQGIIMAEILQPPRARRPYRPIYLKNE